MSPRSRPLVALGALLLVFTVGACGAATTTSDTNAASGSTALSGTSPSDSGASTSTTLTFDELTDAAATATITPDAGGTVTATGPDGTSYELAVPPNAVTADLVVTVTPLSNVKGGISSGPIVAARFEPDGQHFGERVTFTIKPATGIPAAERFMFLADHDGSNVQPAFVDPRTGEATLVLQHFSMAGETGVNDSLFDDAFGTARGDLANASELRIKQLLQEAVRSPERQREIFEEIDAEFDRFEKDVVKPAVEELKDGAPRRCSSVSQLSVSIISVDRQREVAGLSPASVGLRQVAEAAYKDCEREAIRSCKKERKPDKLLQFWLGAEHNRALLGQGTDSDVDGMKEKAKKICVPQRYEANGGGAGIAISGTVADLTRPFALDGVGAGFGVRYNYTPNEDGLGGTLTYEGDGSGMSMSGSGSYTVTGDDPGRLTLTAITNGCVAGVGPNGCRENTNVITLTAIPDNP